MTPEELIELDAWIAEHVFNYKYEKRPDELTADPSPRFYRHKTTVGKWGILVGTPYERANLPNGLTHGISWENFRPTTNPATAMAVLEKCAKHAAFTIIEFESGEWRMANATGDSVVFSDTLPIAICLFAKKLFSK